MQFDANTEKFFQSKVLGHPAGLFVLFFTEMWERFSFYGMRVLLIMFLMMSFVGTNPGWEWSSEWAGSLFGTYASLLYLTPILGGIVADKLLGYRGAVILGAFIMMMGHFCMALETELSLYVGLGLLVIGTGFFKPNITSIISVMYKDLPKKKDGAYTIFYMGVNAGAFFGMMLCGYLGEKVGWSYGFGLAGVFMFFGAVQFWLAKRLFGKIGDRPVKDNNVYSETVTETIEDAKTNPGLLDDVPAKKNVKVTDYVPNKFTLLDIGLIVLSATIGLVYLFNDPLSKIAGFNLLPPVFGEQKYLIVGLLFWLLIILSLVVIIFAGKFGDKKTTRKRGWTAFIFAWVTTGLWASCYHPRFNEAGEEHFYSGPLMILVFAGLIPFLYLCVSRILRYEQVVRHRMFAVICFAIFTVVFFMSFEQGATSLVIFADDYTNRILTGNSAVIFNIVNIVLTLGPLVIISWVLYRLFRETWHEIKWSNIVLALSFVGVWIVSIWILNRDLHTVAYNFSHQVILTPDIDEETGLQKIDKKTKELQFIMHDVVDSTILPAPGTLPEYNFAHQVKRIPLIDSLTNEQVKDEKTGELQFVFQDMKDTTVIQPAYAIVDTVLKFNVQDDVKPSADVVMVLERGAYVLLDDAGQKKIEQQCADHNRGSVIIRGDLIGRDASSVEIPASWFSILNSFFIIAFASFFSKWWESKYNPSAAMKYGIGLVIMGIGFGVLAYGSIPIGDGTAGVRVSMVWLILAYFFHTLGELCVSPVGLSMVSKLVPGRMIGFMFGMWYLAIAIGNKTAASMGGTIEKVVEETNMSTFFFIFTLAPIVVGIVVMCLNPLMKWLMKGVE